GTALFAIWPYAVGGPPPVSACRAAICDAGDGPCGGAMGAGAGGIIGRPGGPMGRGIGGPIGVCGCAWGLVAGCCGEDGGGADDWSAISPTAGTLLRIAAWNSVRLGVGPPNCIAAMKTFDHASNAALSRCRSSSCTALARLVCASARLLSMSADVFACCTCARIRSVFGGGGG